MHLAIAKNTIYQAATRAITAGATFLITILIARQFGVFGYGEFTTITAYVGLFYLLVDFGLNAFYLQRDEEETNFFSLLFFRVLLAVSLVAMANIFSFLLPFSSLRLGILIFSFSIISQAIIITGSSLFQKRLRYHYLLISNAIGSLTGLALVFLAAQFFPSLSFILFALVLGGFFSSFWVIFFVRKNILSKRIHVDFIKNLVVESLPFGFMLVFNLVYFRVDMILLSLLRPTQEVGIYGLSYRFFDFLIALPLFLSNAAYPILLSSKKNPRTLHQKVKKFTYVFFALSIGILTISWFLSPLITFIKSDFSPSITSFRILLLSLPFFFLTNFFQWVLVVFRQQKYLLFIYFIAAVLNIILNVIYIPLFGYIASAIITGVSEGIVLCFLSFKLYSLLKIP